MPGFRMGRWGVLALVVCASFGSRCAATKTDNGSSVTTTGGIERGRYLATGVARCFWCHSPLDDSDPAVPRPDTLGAGDVLDEKAPIVAPNITPDKETGLGDWKDQEMTRAIRKGLAAMGERFTTTPRPITAC
jgi:hypothetical protein